MERSQDNSIVKIWLNRIELWIPSNYSPIVFSIDTLILAHSFKYTMYYFNLYMEYIWFNKAGCFSNSSLSKIYLFCNQRYRDTKMSSNWMGLGCAEARTQNSWVSLVYHARYRAQTLGLLSLDLSGTLTGIWVGNGAGKVWSNAHIMDIVGYFFCFITLYPTMYNYRNWFHQGFASYLLPAFINKLDRFFRLLNYSSLLSSVFWKMILYIIHCSH